MWDTFIWVFFLFETNGTVQKCLIKNVEKCQLIILKENKRQNLYCGGKNWKIWKKKDIGYG